VTSGASVGQKSGGASEADIERGLEDANRKLADAQARVEQINQPVIAYRDELAERLPQAQGARLAFMISDASDRVAAGSRSARAMGFAIRRETMNLVAAGDGVRRIREFALGIRRLAAQKQAVVRRVDIRGGRWAVSGDEVRVDRDALGEAYGMLEAAAKVDGAR